MRGTLAIFLFLMSEKGLKKRLRLEERVRRETKEKSLVMVSEEGPWALT